TMRTARSTTSGENFTVVFFMAPSSQELEPPRNPGRFNAHCGYLLEVPVITSPAGHEKPLRYAAAIENAYRLKLQADPGYAGLICKNPLHERWRNWFLHDHAYSLDELTEWVSLTKPARVTDKNVGLGRNITLFDTLRSWAYRMV
ncbi:replication initiation protein, partial [Thauera aromatica]